ncbi:MAG: glycosyltransferase [Haliea sp.]|nr:glycosyltransferase [Haliea sp.]
MSRAVDSALKSAPDGDVQVIVVPNGPESNWRAELTNSLSDSRVQVHPIATAHACAARNHGLTLATVTYTRFLDDHDVLLSEKACAQLNFIVETGAEVCSGRLRHMNEDLQILGQVGFTEQTDFVCAVCEVSGFTLPTGNVFLTSALSCAAWNEAVPRLQDNVWMMHLATLREWHWVDFNADVGGWVHHRGARVSSTSVRQPLPYWVFDSLISLHEQLIANNRITESRRVAIVEAIWRMAHAYFPVFPFQSHRYARQALLIDPASRQRGYSDVAGVYLPPLLVEWLTVPKRYARHLVQSARQYIRGEEVTRSL